MVQDFQRSFLPFCVLVPMVMTSFDEPMMLLDCAGVAGCLKRICWSYSFPVM